MTDDKELNLENADQERDAELNAENTEIVDEELDQVAGGRKHKHKFTFKKGGTRIQFEI